MNEDRDLTGRERLQGAGSALAYLLLAVPLALLGVGALVAALVASVVSSTGWRVPMRAALRAIRRVADADRRLANRVMEAAIPPRPASEWSTRRLLGYAAAKLPVVLLALLAGVIPIVLAAGLLVLAGEAIVGIGTIEYLGPWRLTPLTGVLLLALTGAMCVLAAAVLDALRRVVLGTVRGLVAPQTPAGAPVREVLAHRLGDRSLSIAYWLPERRAFVDDHGRPVELPEPGSGRAWTAVEHDGRRVAAIVHDAGLDAGDDLVEAAASAAALALDNERLKAALRAQVEELRVSRARVVEAGDDARRRIERDLHDGAQQRLVSVALGLRVLKSRLRGAPEEQSVDSLSEELAAALDELRELARGIHPAVLTTHGLAAAVEALATRSPVPVETRIDVPGRLPPPIEAAAYFTVAEALTNVAKYAGATVVTVSIGTTAGPDLVVEVNDDGVGGADATSGTGLRGLTDRLAAVEGTLSVVSPPGEGTRVRARIAGGARLAAARDARTAVGGSGSELAEARP